MSVEALKIAMKRREAKGKGEKEKYTHFTAELQRIARRDKKVFLNDPCKEIEQNSRMGKTRALLEKIRDTKGIFPSFRFFYIILIFSSFYPCKFCLLLSSSFPCIMNFRL